MFILSVENLTFSYQNFPVLKGLALTVERGDMVAIRGPSGSGKSTLFYLLGGLLTPSQGKIDFQGLTLNGLSGERLAMIRNQKIGFVFQQFNLLPHMNVIENVLLPLQYPLGREIVSQAERMRAQTLLDQMKIRSKALSFPNQLSGGEQQRVAIARALIRDPELILADEPTGNLDTSNTDIILKIFEELHENGKTIIIITHDSEVGARCRRVIHIRDGHIVESEEKKLFALKPVALYKTQTKEYFHSGKMLLDGMSLAFHNLKRNKVRSTLNMIGVTIGIASVLSMVTFGGFIKKNILKSYEDLGVNKVLIRGYPNWNQRATDRTDIIFERFSWEKDVLTLTRVFEGITHMTPVLNQGGNQLQHGGKFLRDDIRTLGVNENYLSISNLALSLGRPINVHDVDGKSPVCIIGTEVREKLFTLNSPLGQMFFISGDGRLPYPCQVIGVIEPQVSNKDWRKPNLEVLMPYTYFSTVNDQWSSNIRHFLIQVSSGVDIEKLSASIKGYFVNKFGKSGEFSVGSDAILMAQMRKFISLFGLLLISVAVVALGVGGMGIHNMMLVSLSERLQEIGLRKAIGATNRNIRFQFLLESVILCLVAGFIGLLLGFITYEVIIYVASKFVSKIKFEWVLNGTAIFVSFFSILLVGMLSGIIPALKAERLQIIDALRTE